MSLTNSLTKSLGRLRLQQTTQKLAGTNEFITNQQVRSKMTKTKKRRLLKKANYLATGKPKNLPPNYIPKDKPILVSPNAERLSLAQAPPEAQLSNLLRERKQQIDDDVPAPPLRFHFSNLEKEMSPKVRQLFNLTNGSSDEFAKAQKAKAMELFQIRPGDTGSSAVQIMALTSRIQQVQNHVNTHKKDYSGKRGLDAMYVRRRKLLDYLERKDFDEYKVVVNGLGLVR